MNTSEAKVSNSDLHSDTPDVQKLKSRNRKPWLWLLLALSLTVNSIFLWRMFAWSGTSKPALAQQQPTAPPKRPVETVILTRGNATTSVSLLGQVEASQQSTIRAQTGGIVKDILVRPGDRVKTGMAIAILDDSDQQLAISRARAELAQQRSNLARLEVGTRPEIIAQRQAAVTSAQAREQEARDNLTRTTDLVKQGALSQRVLVEVTSAVDEARGQKLAAQAALAEAKAGPIKEEIAAQKANVAAAEAALNQAKLAQQRTRILSLESGVVQARHISRGDLVQDSDQIVTLVSGNALDIFLELPEELSGKVTPGMPIELTARALPQWKERTKITAVVPAADAASRRQRVRVQLDNPPQRLLPGMAIAGNLVMPSNQPSFVVSRDALTRRQNQWLVFTVANGKARQLEVEMVADMGRNVAISHPQLRAGERIVLRGGDGLSDGAAVKVLESQPRSGI
ncbi:efflux RND transporter periplasmic adaptor subunit [Chlorogloeopsis sp. ULAP01]|uniref:efflux RND transporter periplasmic adaptor subunit n=1 Tax=Chlorogloeopsis sp. ULAP01 TaxID=3056483 RepID=UPI0025AA724C|nr:efflux RND transporter periplasmic adaptor subunit [Chlorogloeopsis sp. ULAP01]MDM9382958.1 efflux RND transporter periplasmic adaptor subunit [Chlorogloeopsis sp. ULAP01]